MKPLSTLARTSLLAIVVVVCSTPAQAQPQRALDPDSGPTLTLTRTPIVNCVTTLTLSGPPQLEGWLLAGESRTRFPGALLPLDLVVPVVLDSSGSVSLPMPTCEGRRPIHLAFTSSLPATPTVPIVFFGNLLDLPSTPGGLLGNMLGDLLSRPAPQPLGPFITNVQPNHGKAGDVITIHGGNFGNGAVEDICVGVPGSNGILMRAVSRTDTQVVAQITAVMSNPQPAPLVLGLGDGLVVPIPPMHNHTFDPIWVWDGGPSDPSKMAASPGDFTADPDDPPICGEGIYDSSELTSLMPDEVSFFVPDVVPGSIIRIQAHLRYLDQGSVVREGPDIECSAHPGPGVTKPEWLMAIADSMSMAFMAQGAAVSVSINFALCLIRIKVLNGIVLPASYGILILEFDPGDLTKEEGGVADGCALPSEPALPLGGTGFAAFVAGHPMGPGRDFDEALTDRVLGHTFTGWIPGIIDAAYLEIALCAGTGGSADDTLSIGWNGTTFDWSVSLAALNGGSWSPPDTMTLSLNLADLPLPGGGAVDLLSSIASGRLDIFVEDDTAVDFATIRVYKAL